VRIFEHHGVERTPVTLRVISGNAETILIEAFSLFLIGEMNAAYWPVWAELTLILVYPFASLLLCTVAGLGVRKVSTALFGDVFFSPPSTLYPSSTSR